MPLFWLTRAPPGVLARAQVAECMPYNGPGPRNANELPKRKRKGNRKKQECIPLMMALLACYKSNNYARLSPPWLLLLTPLKRCCRLAHWQCAARPYPR